MYDMKRMTKRRKDGTVFLSNESSEKGFCYFRRKPNFPEIIDRLAEYEDLGLSPSEINDIVKTYEMLLKELLGTDEISESGDAALDDSTYRMSYYSAREESISASGKKL